MKTLVKNKAAYHEYEILEKMEAGISLVGHEVKSVKQGNISLRGAYANIIRDEAYLLGAHIPLFKFAIAHEYEPTRTRKLLLHKQEINKLIGKIREKGISLLPLEVYEKNGKVKVLLGLGRGKRQFEKREKIKKKEAEREMQRIQKERSR